MPPRRVAVRISPGRSRATRAERELGSHGGGGAVRHSGTRRGCGRGVEVVEEVGVRRWSSPIAASMEPVRDGECGRGVGGARSTAKVGCSGP
jgi:hypothetical protein